MSQFVTKTVQNDDFCDDFRAAFPHLLRFGEKNRRSHFPPQNVVYMQKGIKIGPVVLHIFLGIYGVKPEICIYVQRFHIF